MTFPDVLFYLMAALTLGCGGFVAFSRNIVHSGFALLGAFAGVAGLYGLLSAHFVAAVQILVYVGGVLIVILFAIMLTRGIGEVKASNPHTHLWPAVALSGLVALVLIVIAVKFPWRINTPGETIGTVPRIGDALLGEYLVPFEVLSVVLLAALIGAVMLVRKEIKTSQAGEVQ